MRFSVQEAVYFILYSDDENLNNYEYTNLKVCLIFFRILSHVKAAPGSRLSTEVFYSAYKKAALYQQLDYVNIQIFGQKKVKTFYQGIAMEEHFDWTVSYNNFKFKNFLVAHDPHNKTTTVAIRTKYVVNGHNLSKCLELTSDGTWTMSIVASVIDLDRLQLQPQYSTAMIP